MPQGSRGYIGYKKEVTWGVDPTGAPTAFFPFISENLTPKIPDLLSAAQRGLLDEPKSYQGEKSFGGDLLMEVHPVSIGHILRSALGAPKGEVLAGSTITLLCDCEEKWTANSGVISSLDPADKKKGSYSVKLQVTEGVDDPAILGYFTINPSVSMIGATSIKFWIKCSKITAGGDLVLRVSENAAGADTPEAYEDMDVPILAKDVWQECTVTITEASDLGVVISVALVMTVDLDEFEVHLDDIRFLIEDQGSASWTHEFVPMQTKAEEFAAGAQDSPLWPYTLDIFRDEGLPFALLGAVVNTMTLSFSTTDKILKAACGILAKNMAIGTAGTPGLEATKPFVWENATIKVGGGPPASGAMNDIESFSLTWDNKCVPKYFLNNTAIPGKIIREGVREIPVSFVIDFANRTEYDLFLLGTERAFQIKFVGASCETGPPKIYYTLQIDLPLVRYLAYPLGVAGPGRLTCAVTGKAKYSSNVNFVSAMLVNLTNTKQTAEYAG